MAPKLLSLVFLVVFLLSLSFETKGSNTGFVLVKPPAATTTHFDALFDSEYYLRRYGYFDYAQLNLEIGASEEQILELATKTYQENFGIKPTGKLDDETLSQMKTARCGNRDIIDGVNSMKPRSRSM
ncbi:neutrophil collagenase [Salvia divinorum]|uniref:Neutrophil collagenase n=1 Tax=Salvia divinorum TaxID=28513 RepID=A0ABD1H0J3_SALDI